jgi:intracellular sulfur oxidation DsrE/DsrF family protein
MPINRGAFLAAGALGAASAGLAHPASAASATFDRAAFEVRLRLPFRHRQAFASGQVADGAVLGFMYNSLNAYETGFGEGAGTLHAAAVFYRNAVALGLDDDAWRSYALTTVLRNAGDRVTSSAEGNPFLHTPPGWAIADLQRRNASFFVCQNALNGLALRCGTSLQTLEGHLLPGMMLVPAGVAAVNALQEERFTLFVATD